MANKKRFYTEYLSFTKKERIGIISLLVFIAVIFILPHLLAEKEDMVPIKINAELLEAKEALENRRMVNDDLEQSAQNFQYEKTQNNIAPAFTLFAFDPNSLPAEGWEKLGLTERTIKTIVNYRNKGGKFYQPEDLKKIWGLPEGFYDRVKDYIIIKRQTPANQPAFVEYKKAERIITLVDINTADTSAFIALPGIGSKLALRIVNFRSKLGGFYSAEQVAETYGLPDSTFRKIKAYLVADASTIKKLNINTASKEELKEHPYIKWNLANAIVEYRKQHGHFIALEELKNVQLVDNTSFEKMKHYLSL